ncbi:toll-like receptor 4 [Ylistrum balloti]|uniref:toll-like receptor 4 n=1 Tax=Ylistrum balloti TaxID=509963 RepID=UPI002905A877|nr:toll-like receptor 4 [Ylistrum balloti]
MEIIDSTYVITYRELQKLYTEHSEEVNAKYPCFIPPSLERYVERNISVVSNTNGHVNLDAKERHHQNIPICNYTQLNYYEKSLSTTDKSRFVNKFLSKGNFPSLRVLNLSYLYLKRAPEKLCKDRFLEEFPALQFVDLSHNRLSDIEFGTFGDLREQVSFDMGHNNIRVVSATVLSTLRTIYPGVMVLRGNPFSCRCDQKDLFQFLKNSAEPLVTHYRYLLSVRCKTPLKYRGRLLGDVPFHNDCYLSDKHSNVLIVVPVVSVTCCVAAFIIYLVYRKCLGCFQCKRPKQNPTEPLLVTSDNFQYDAFISYSQEDETLVKMMCGRLEGPPYNAILCLHNRHFVPGVSITDNIFQAVESSRHTVVVLSEHFLESHWCMTEFREANRKGILDNKRHLVAIVMEEFDDHATSLPQELSMFLKTHTYIRVSELNFWEKLVNAIKKYTTDEDASGISSVKSNAAGKNHRKAI